LKKFEDKMMTMRSVVGTGGIGGPPMDKGKADSLIYTGPPTFSANNVKA
jgi:hypothetical protein